LDTWLAIQHDGSVTAFFGKMDPGQGVDVAIRQIVAEELDIAVERVAIVMGDTARTANQGGASGSTGIERGGITLRYAGAEARRVCWIWPHSISALRSKHCACGTEWSLASPTLPGRSAMAT
jgi:CO/xanthine dehydrogenase Mo-binding subunit